MDNQQDEPDDREAQQILSRFETVRVDRQSEASNPRFNNSMDMVPQRIPDQYSPEIVLRCLVTGNRIFKDSYRHIPFEILQSEALRIRKACHFLPKDIVLRYYSLPIDSIAIYMASYDRNDWKDPRREAMDPSQLTIDPINILLHI